ncbi:hypothetical protein C5C36_06455 [Rathayibacter sp. AY1G1]|uniref:dGTP triphosphohydrolase n=1 Tax=unclassified Rathayibacter TaxID=2609250 RepID=UPI000CE8108B|nr:MULTISPECIES: dNTP triphosphohydrolase [unclassified Rathayibacter]PPH14229.1 hypothetical protein C5C36_06455 [Rathayibacter sp. AY1G1]PPH16423.1 hypothetical protein C5C35_10255 [Rathayibacter sp. AY1F8]
MSKQTKPEKLLVLPDGSLYKKESYKSRYSRVSEEVKSLQHDARTETEKDRGRVAYSSYVRRLSGVTQVTSPTLNSSRLHTRESHSQKVSLVSREIAEGIARSALANPSSEAYATILEHGGLDLAACETAGLAHDLGHPPFGHGGEVALNESLRRRGVIDGFEGNPQTFRILTKLELRKLLLKDTNVGLDLTYVTLAAVLKYPRECPEDQRTPKDGYGQGSIPRPPKFGFFGSEDEDRRAFDGATALLKKGANGQYRQTLEASIMDLADDISYATHDLEDLYREGRIDFYRVDADLGVAIEKLEGGLPARSEELDLNAFIKIAHTLSEDYQGLFSVGSYNAALSEVLRMIRISKMGYQYDGDVDQTSRVSAFTSSMVEAVFASITVTRQPAWKSTSKVWNEGPSVYATGDGWHRMQVLKTITKRYVIATSRMSVVERAQSKVVNSLFTELATWVEECKTISDIQSLPEPLASFITAEGWGNGEMRSEYYRAVADYICGLSDEECLLRAKWLQGLTVPEFGSVR